MTPSTLALTLITIVLWGLIPIFDKLALSQHAVSPLVGIAIRTVAVTVLAVPLALTVGKAGPALKALPPGAVVLYALSGLASLLLAQYAYYKLLARADVSRVFPLLFAAAPIVTIAIGVFWLKEPMSLKQALGAALVVAGGLLLL